MILKNVAPKRYQNKNNKGNKDHHIKKEKKKRKEKFLKRSNITCNKKMLEILSITMQKSVK